MGQVTQKSSLNSDAGEYFSEVLEVHTCSSVIGFHSRLVHRLMVKPVREERLPMVLNVGAGEGQHAPFAASDVDGYSQTGLAAERLAQQKPRRNCVVPVEANAEKVVSLAVDSVDRLVATCLLPIWTSPRTPSGSVGGLCAQVV